MTTDLLPISMLDAALMYQDPPEIKAEGGIMPVNEWPGRRMTREDVVRAAQNGFGRDWFRFWHRYELFEAIWEEGGLFDQAREGKPDEYYFDNFEWNQTLVFGDYGNGKSTWFGGKATEGGLKGIPPFHSGLYLGGWLFEGDDSFTMMETMPKCAILGHDESNTTAGKNFHQAIAYQVLVALGVNIRKLNVDWYLIGRKWKDLPPGILEDCKEAVELLPNIVRVENAPPGLEEWNNPANFQLRWRGWRDYPYRKMMDRRRERKVNKEDYDPENEDDFGPPDYYRRLGVEEARVAFALTDSFRLADMAGFLANKDNVRETLRETRGLSVGGGRTAGEAAVLEMAATVAQLRHEGEEIQFVPAAEIAKLFKMTPQAVGTAAGGLGLKNYRGKGYSVNEMISMWREETGLREEG